MRILRRFLVRGVPVLLIVSLLTMLLVSLIPGDPAYVVLGGEPTPEQVARVHEQLGLDQNIIQRYFDWLGGVLTGDFGTSVRTQQPVLDSILDRLAVTAELTLLAGLMATVIAIPIGILTAHRADTPIDKAWSVSSSVLISLPHFISGLLLVYLLSVSFDIFPVTGWVPFTRDPIDNLYHLVLPALTLALYEVPVLSRLLRSDMLSTLQSDYILAARAKGLPTRFILWRHALRPSSFSVITLGGLSLGRLIGGAIIVETIFGLPGLGQLLIQAIQASDFSMIQGTVMFVAMVYVFVNFSIDLLYGVVDPRTRGPRGVR